MGRELNILIIQNSREDVDEIARDLRRDGVDFTTTVAGDQDNFANAVSRFRPDVILSDQRLPQLNGNYKTCTSIPFILTTSTAFAVECIKHAASDHVRLKHLPVCIKNAIEKSTMEDAMTKAQVELKMKDAILKQIAWMQSHQVRAPLARILGLINLINSGIEIDLKNVLQYITRSGHELDDVIRQIVMKTEDVET